MAGYSNEDILNLFIIHGECNRILLRTCITFNERYPLLPPMTAKKFRRIQSNFRRFGNVRAERNIPKPVTSNEDNIVSVLTYSSANPSSSLRSAVEEVGLSYSSNQRILNNHKWHDFKFTPSPALKPQDLIMRQQFCEFMLVKIQENPNFLRMIVWTDEAKFSREGLTCSKNNHHWAPENPHAIRVKNNQEQFSFNVFCLIKDNKIAFEIYNENLTRNKYLDILNNTVMNFLEEHLCLNDYLNCWFQLDGASAHRTHEVSQWLTTVFEDRWIRLDGPWVWPPRSMDLTPLDFYLWGRVKQIVYETPVANREDLEERVRGALNQLDPEEIRRAVESVESRVIQCLNSGGRRFEHFR